MSGVQSFVTPGFGAYVWENMHYVQAVRVENIIKLSGQGGWETQKEKVDIENLFPSDIGQEIDNAFANVDFILKHTGGKGFSQVYKVRTYSLSIPAQHEHIVRNLRKWLPGSPPIWTELGVKELGAPTMNFEIDVEAYDPQERK